MNERATRDAQRARASRGARASRWWALTAGLLGVALGGASLLALIPSASAQVCARVKIEIVQELTLERQAFDARMRITNGLQNLAIENVGVNVTFEDAQGNPVEASSDPNSTTASFFITLDSLDGINAVDGTGTIAPETAGTINWLIIPAPGAAGPSEEGTLYFVGAQVTYSIGGDVREVEVVPDSIYVKPMPRLYLDYFLPEQVHSNNPYTPQIEPPVPFTLGVRVANDGYGPARNLKINSSQPKIVENELGLLIAFEIIGSEVNGQPATPSLLVEFGDIQPDSASIARWFMTSTLQGKFVEFTATFSHADELGGQLTSLLEEVNTHVLVHDVLVTVPGRDGLRDFLAADPDGLRVYESDNVDTEVFDASSTASATSLGGDLYRVSSGAFAGFGYISLSDPLNGSKQIVQVTRADGRVIDPANAWLSKEWVKDSQSHLHYVNIFDHANTGPWHYDVQFGGAVTGNLAPVFGPTPDRNVRVGETLVYSVTATDPNGTVPTLQAAPLPVGATFEDLGNGTGLLTWSPGASSLGSYPVDFSAYDGALFGLATAIINVVPADATNQPPTATSALIHARKNQASQPVTPTVTDPDPDDSHFFDVLTQPQHGEAMVSNNQLVYMPDEDYVGLDSFQFEAMDLFGETVTGTAEVIVTDGDNLEILGIDLVGGATITAVAVHLETTGSIASIVPTTVTLAAHGCDEIVPLGSVTQAFGAGPTTLQFPVDLSTLGASPITLVATLDANNELPEEDEFDNRAARGVRVGGAELLSLSLESSGAAPEVICSGQVLTATGRSYFVMHEATGSCIGPFAGAAIVEYELEDLQTGSVVRSGTVIADSNGAWHVEFGMPSAPGAAYELRTFTTDGENLNAMTRSFATATCAPAIPPPMVPAPDFPGPSGDVPVVRFIDGAAKLPWTIYPGMAIPGPGLDGSGIFGHTRGTGSLGEQMSGGPAIGSTGGVAQELVDVEGEPTVVSTFDASVDSQDIVSTPASITAGQTVTLRGVVEMNDSYYGLPTLWSVTEPGGNIMPLAPPMWGYANGLYTVLATFTPRQAGAHSFHLELGPDFSDADSTNDGGQIDRDIDPDVSADAPTLASVAPHQGLAGDVLAITIQGSKFTAEAEFDCGPGIAISDLAVQLDGEAFGSTATATFTIAAEATVGPRTCTVTTEFDSASLVEAFFVVETLCDLVSCTAPPGPCYASTGTCDLADGSCSYAPLAAGTPCDDGVACTVGDTCDGAGLCGSLNHLSCNDGIACTSNVCDPQTGCLNVPQGPSCDPGACLMGGDINGSGSLNVSDAMCIVLISFYYLEGATGELPMCLAGPPSLADLNCSGNVNVADVQIAIQYILSVPLNSSIDRNHNNCVDACDALDCGPDACDPVEEQCLICGADCGPCAGSCCEPQLTGGCNDTAVQECVCSGNVMPQCCSVIHGWTEECAQAAITHCGLTCQ